METYRAKGYINFCYSPYGLLTQVVSEEKLIGNAIHPGQSEETKEFIKEDIIQRLTIETYDLMSGEEFVSHLKSGSIIDYDGTLSEVFVDGYISNLGIVYKGFQQGKFLVSLKEFEILCDNYNIEVNWANK